MSEEEAQKSMKSGEVERTRKRNFESAENRNSGDARPRGIEQTKDMKSWNSSLRGTNNKNPRGGENEGVKAIIFPGRTVIRH